MAALKKTHFTFSFLPSFLPSTHRPFPLEHTSTLSFTSHPLTPSYHIFQAEKKSFFGKKESADKGAGASSSPGASAEDSKAASALAMLSLRKVGTTEQPRGSMA